MKRIIILGLLGAVCLVWGCGEDTSTPVTAPSGSSHQQTSTEPGLIVKPDLIGAWQGTLILSHPSASRSDVFFIDLTFTDSLFDFRRAEADTHVSHCPYVYAYGPWATDGLSLFWKNHAIYLMDCSYDRQCDDCEYVSQPRLPWPMLLNGDSLIILATPVHIADSLVNVVYLDTFRLERVK